MAVNELTAGYSRANTPYPSYFRWCYRKAMKKAAMTLMLAFVLILSSGNLPTSEAEARLPSVGPNIAKNMTFKVLRQSPFWRYRSTGFVNCAYGRISRTEWACRVGIIKRQTCRRGRARIFSYYDYFFEEYSYRSILNLGPRYSCEGVNY